MEPAEEFRSTISAAVELVAGDPTRLVTLGIKPLRPATGYGYIQRGAPLTESRRPAFRVQRFCEKPVREVAEQFVRSPDFYWNSGGFVWSAKTILQELRSRRPELCQALERIRAAWGTDRQQEVLAREFAGIQPISIDYAVLEHAQNTCVIEAAFRWDDVGSWGALERLRGADSNGNTVQGLHCGLDTHSCTVIADPDHLVATAGVDNLIIVQCGDCTLVADKANEESVKRLVELVRQQGMERFL